ncbi:Membrane-bound lytic murein transglycosylase D [hydrothermal vent metagenome]|uniref:Membrane-bound lytic murein transglycosylase D n=1 Tax=hydrothermal vent metagenome TaxID=652676 RepID=A0A3B0ZNK2_9ZZZZ
MPQATNKTLFKIITFFSSLLLLSGCLTQPQKSEKSPPETISQSDNKESLTPPEEQPNVESIHYLSKQQGSEALHAPLEPLIPDTLDLPTQPPLPLTQFGPDSSPHQSLSGIVENQPFQEIKPTDLWHRLRQQYALPDSDHPRIKYDQNRYTKNSNHLLQLTERAHPYLHYILEEIEARDMPAEIALLPMVESAFLPFAYSHGQAAGIWQFIPSTGKHFGLKQNWWYDGRRDVYASTKAALTYLQQLHKTFDGDWLLALAAYNSGAGTVSRAIRKNKNKGKPTDYWHLDLPKETEKYVPKLLALSNIIADPEAFDIKLTPIPDKSYFEKVEINGQIDLALAAELAELGTDKLYSLNPGFNRWATDPNGPHYLLIPEEKASIFTQALAQLPDNQRVKWIRHRIQPGESLLLIAKKHQTTVDLLRDTNKLNSNMIRAGQHLLIPTATRHLSRYTQSSELRKRAIQQRQRDGEKITHTIQRGDTLWDISRKHKVSVRELAKWNAMAPKEPIRPGQKLLVWRKKSPDNSLSAPLQIVNYKVRQGDSLARIAQKFRVSITDLQRWNSLNIKKYLQPGQRLTLHVDVIRQSGG